MAAEDHSSKSIETLIDRLDEVLEKADLKDNFRDTALIGLAFCDLLAASLDDHQKEAVEAARNFWDGRNPDVHREFVYAFAGIIDSDMRTGTARRQAALNRIIWIALNTNTALTGYACEFLIGLGSDAGLNIQQMTDIFSEHVPGFEASNKIR